MNKIFVLAIVASLNAPLKGEVMNVRPSTIIGSKTAEVTEMGGDSKKISLSKDIDSPLLNVKFYDVGFNEFDNIKGIDGCNTDTSIDNGTISTILLQSLNLDGCPIPAGDYTVGERYNVTGSLDVFDYVGELVTLSVKIFNGEDQSLSINYHLKLLERN